MKKMLKKVLTVCILTLSMTPVLMAQQGALDEETLKKANDPMAHTKSLNMQDYLVSDIYGAPDAVQNQLLFRYAQPIGKFLLRATMPVITASSPSVVPKSGFGDFNLFAIYAVEKGGNKYGIGPVVTAPTGASDFSARKWQGGVAVMAFFAKNPVFQTGALLQWQTSFAGSDNAPDVNVLTSQLFGMWQLGGGTYLRSTGVWSFNLENGDYNVPLGLGIGKVLKVNKVVFNLFAEPQFSILAKGNGQARFQTFIGFNTQF